MPAQLGPRSRAGEILGAGIEKRSQGISAGISSLGRGFADAKKERKQQQAFQKEKDQQVGAVNQIWPLLQKTGVVGADVTSDQVTNDAKLAMFAGIGQLMTTAVDLQAQKTREQMRKDRLAEAEDPFFQEGVTPWGQKFVASRSGQMVFAPNTAGGTRSVDFLKPGEAKEVEGREGYFWFRPPGADAKGHPYKPQLVRPESEDQLDKMLRLSGQLRGETPIPKNGKGVGVGPEGESKDLLEMQAELEEHLSQLELKDTRTTVRFASRKRLGRDLWVKINKKRASEGLQRIPLSELLSDEAPGATDAFNPPKQTESGRPSEGDTVDGFRYVGGDPREQSSWEPVE
ncbi:hypothetical protein N9937_01630 [bacterium]|nr:hypothetical protein [bacterium]